jgi:hypothetical protein
MIFFVLDSARPKISRTASPGHAKYSYVPITQALQARPVGDCGTSQLCFFRPFVFLGRGNGFLVWLGSHEVHWTRISTFPNISQIFIEIFSNRARFKTIDPCCCSILSKFFFIFSKIKKWTVRNSIRIRSSIKFEKKTASSGYDE